jgi:hypothetical protein
MTDGALFLEKTAPSVMRIAVG